MGKKAGGPEVPTSALKFQNKRNIFYFRLETLTLQQRLGLEPILSQRVLDKLNVKNELYELFMGAENICFM